MAERPPAGRDSGRAGPGCLLLTACLAALGPGCGDPCCHFDNLPTVLGTGPGGELLVRVLTPSGPDWAVLDTGSPLTFWGTASGQAAGPRITEREIVLLAADPYQQSSAVRARIRDVRAVSTRLGAIGRETDTLLPAAIVGADVLAHFTVGLDFAGPTLTLWPGQPASDDFLSGAGYAVLHVLRLGGGTIAVSDPEDGIGGRDGHSFGPTRVLVQACGEPAPFDRAAPPAACCPGQERTLTSGTDLSLLVATGVGPLVLTRSAFARLVAESGAAVSPGAPGSLLLPTSLTPVPATFTQLSSLVLVDRESDLAADPGPCGELARARRIEQVAFARSQNPESPTCVSACDADTGDGNRTANTAAHLALGNQIPVAVVDDGLPLLQALREELRPRAPEVDGLLGAEVLRSARVELDYRAPEMRAVFSCAPGTPETLCRAVARCPPDGQSTRPGPVDPNTNTSSCFGLAAHGLPDLCNNPGTCAD